MKDCIIFVMTTNWRKQFGTINGNEERYRKGN